MSSAINKSVVTTAASMLTLAQAAALLGIHPDTLRERAASGAISGAKIGKAWRFIEADLLAYFRSQYRGAAAYRSASGDRSAGSVNRRHGEYGSIAGTADDELDALLQRGTRQRRSARTTKAAKVRR